MKRPQRVLAALGLAKRPGDEIEREIEEELRHHIELRTDANIAAGMDPKAARADSLNRMGDIDDIRLSGRRVLAGSPPPRSRDGFVDSLRQDIRHALRMPRRSPAFAVTVILVLALGIGATSTIFTVAHAVLFRPLDHPEIDRLARISVVDPRGLRNPPPELVAAWKERSELFEEIDEWSAWDISFYTLSGHGEAVSVGRQWVGAGFFNVLGVEPILGRTFAPEDMERNQSTTVVLSHELWSRHFDEDPEVLGKTVDLMSRPRTIIGVMPPGFRIDPAVPAADVWMVREWLGTSYRQSALGRLRPDVSHEQAKAELESIAGGILAGLGDDTEDQKGQQVELAELGEETRSQLRELLYLQSGLVGFVLLICCANVGGLLLVRGGHTKAGVRHAVGTRGRALAACA